MILTGSKEDTECVVGVDPGETTGLFAIRLGEGARLIDRLKSGAWFPGQIERHRVSVHLPLNEAATQKSIAGRLIALASAWQLSVLHVAVEDFTLRERTQERSLLAPVRMTSGILAYLHETSDANFVIHFNSASDGKSIVTDQMLQKAGVYSPGKPHANDAARQAILHLRKAERSRD